MTYKIISNKGICGKKQGETITAKELDDNKANIDALVNGGHIVKQVSPVKPLQEGAKKPTWQE